MSERDAAPFPFAELPTPEATRDVVARIKGGDRAAWDALYRRYRDELLFAARARLGAKLRAYLESEDILQSVALEAFEELPRFEPRGAGSLRGHDRGEEARGRRAADGQRRRLARDS
jgi:hypothetical protein